MELDMSVFLKDRNFLSNKIMALEDIGIGKSFKGLPQTYYWKYCPPDGIYVAKLTDSITDRESLLVYNIGLKDMLNGGLDFRRIAPSYTGHPAFTYVSNIRTGVSIRNVASRYK